jgi:hypothetical protein
MMSHFVDKEPVWHFASFLGEVLPQLLNLTWEWDEARLGLF